jgi:primosomal protein N' (replication factor Y) (superfamily II helicase)
LSQFPTDLSTALWYRIALATPRLGPLIYRVEQADGALQPGDWCLAPLGSRQLLGLVLAVLTELPGDLRPEQIRPITSVRPVLPRLSQSNRRLYAFAATYYRRPLGAVLATAVPPYLQKASVHLRLTQMPYKRSVPKPHTAEALPSAQICPPSLTEEQAEAVQAIRGHIAEALANRPSPPVLLHGVTGSGKTRVYTEAMQEVWAGQPDAQVLLMVPEIGLTPQLEQRMHQAFPDKSRVSLHSAMPEKQRADAWLCAVGGTAQLIIGTRLSVLTPFPRLRLIIVDEEHDAALKQQDGLRYSARDLAVYRAREEHAAVILGSATPSLESLARSEEGTYRRLVLSHQATGAARPKVRLIDTLADPATDGLTATARKAIGGVLESGGQVLVFLNRRGWAPVLGCESCGWAQNCGSCQTPMVLHRMARRWRLICHHCGLQASPPQACPDCGAPDVGPLGRGIQKLEDTLKRAFPDAQIARLDRDAIRNVKDMRAAIQDIATGRVQIIVGTQIMAKGHDLPGLRLVVIADADQQLLHPDFRAPEWLLATLTQVAGRAGRHTVQAAYEANFSEVDTPPQVDTPPPAEVLIQTRYPQHPLFQAIVTNTTDQYAAQLLEERRTAGLPPYGHMAIVRLSDTNEDRLRAWADTLYRSAQDWLRAQRAAPQAEPAWHAAQVYPPAPDYPERRAGRLRWHLVVEGPTRAIRAQIAAAVEDLHAAAGTRVDLAVEIDPLSQS